MGRTVPSFRNVLEMEKKWKSFRNALGKSERKEFDEMFDIPRLYITACSNSVQLVPFHPIAMSKLFHHYKELMRCSQQLEEITIMTMTRRRVKVQVEEQEEIEPKQRQSQRQSTQLKLSDF